MNGRQFTFGVSGHPLAQLLAMLVMALVLVAAVVMGAFVLMLLIGLFVIGYVAFKIRAWWHRQRSRSRAAFGSDAQSGPVKAIRYIEGEFEVVEAARNDARRRSGPRH
jgi:UPF0716 family protein affecting phage T7 exclusion